MTADQMPDELYVFTSQQGERITYHASTDSDTCGTKYTRATPPKSQGVEEAIAWAKNQILASREKANDCRLPDHIARLSLIYAQRLESLISATRQHPTPAQAQGESVTVEEIIDLFDYYAHVDEGGAFMAQDPAYRISTIKDILSKYTIIKRTE